MTVTTLLHARPLGWQREAVGHSAGFEFRAWLDAFVYSSTATRALESYCARYGLRQELDDARHVWYLRLEGTHRRGNIPETLKNEDAATGYALRAMRNAVVDLARGSGTEASVAPDDPRMMGAIEDRDVDVNPEAATELKFDASCESVRRGISISIRERSITCSGVRSEEVGAIALYVVNALCADDNKRNEGAEQAANLRGGTTEFDRLIYQAMAEVVPHRMNFKDNRASDASRTYKRRCTPCVRRVIAAAASEPEAV